MDLDYLLCVLGLVLIIEGTPYFAFAHRIKDWLRQIIELPESTLRAVGLTAMIAGVILIYIGRR
jgi:uncharacterized protein YjeT (DUF2065 family)